LYPGNRFVVVNLSSFVVTEVEIGATLKRERERSSKLQTQRCYYESYSVVAGVSLFCPRALLRESNIYPDSPLDSTSTLDSSENQTQ